MCKTKGQNILLSSVTTQCVQHLIQTAHIATTTDEFWFLLYYCRIKLLGSLVYVHLDTTETTVKLSITSAPAIHALEEVATYVINERYLVSHLRHLHFLLLSAGSGGWISL